MVTCFGGFKMSECQNNNHKIDHKKRRRPERKDIRFDFSSPYDTRDFHAQQLDGGKSKTLILTDRI